MNYWPAHPGALPECAEPLFRLVEDLAEAGRKTAHAHYGARGWVAHHNTDVMAGHRTDRRGRVGPLAHGWGVALPAPVGPLSVHAESPPSGARLSATQRSGRVLRRQPGARPEKRALGDLSQHLAGEPASPGYGRVRRTDHGQRDPARLVAGDCRSGLAARGRCGVSPATPRDPGQPRALSHWPGRAAAGMAGGLGPRGAGAAPSPPVAPLRPLSLPSDLAHRDARARPRLLAERSSSAATKRPAGASPGRSTSGPGWGTASAPTSFSSSSSAPTGATRTCSTPIRPFRSMAISGEPRGSWRCL